MKKLIEILRKQLMGIEYERKIIRTTITSFLIKKETIELLPVIIDDIDISKLRKEVTEEFQTRLDYIEKLVGWFKDYPEEPQIKRALKYIDEIMTFLKTKVNRSIGLVSNLDKKYQHDIESYKALLSKLMTYNKCTYIEENEFLSLVENIDEAEIDDEIIELLIRIGKNNALIKIQKENNEHLFGIDKGLYETIDRDRNPDDSINNFFLQVENVLKSHNYIYAIVGNLKIVEDIQNCFRDLLNIKSNIDYAVLEEADLFKEELELIDNKTVFMTAVVSLMLDAFKQNNGELMISTLDKYKDSRYNDKIDSFEMQLVNSKRAKIQKIIDEYYVEEEYIKFISAYHNIDEQELVKFIDLETIQNMKIMELINCHSKYINSMNIEQLDKLLMTLENQIAIYQGIQNEVDQESSENVIDGLDISDVLNYVVFLNPERIEQNIEAIKLEHDVKSSLFALALYKLFMISQNELYSRDTCKPIMESVGKTNEYDIREERAGSIRICFKTITTYDGHVIYEVLGFAFGSCGDKKKNDNLKLSFKEYLDHYQEYKTFEQIFYDRNVTEMTNIVDQGLTFYNQLYYKNKKKQLGV